MVEAPGTCTSLEVFAGRSEESERVAPVQRAGCWEGSAAALVRTPVQDLVIGVAWNGEDED